MKEDVYDAEHDRWITIERNVEITDTVDAYVLDPDTGKLVCVQLGPDDNEKRQW